MINFDEEAFYDHLSKLQEAVPDETIDPVPLAYALGYMHGEIHQRMIADFWVRRCHQLQRDNRKKQELIEAQAAKLSRKRG